MKTGKLEIHLLRKLLETYTKGDPRVVIGPKVGEDAAVIDPGEESPCYWVVTADPITFTSDLIGHYGVVVNINDIATMGAIPRWFLATLLFPEGETSEEIIEDVFHQIHQACNRFGVAWVGGHTEITPGIERTVLSGMMIGEVRKDRLVSTGGAREGDLLVLAKGVCIEATSILARERKAELLSRGIPSSLIERAKNFIYDPGIDILQPARVACDSVPVHSMHDPTEGGLINGIFEMALASEKTIEVDLERVHIYEESQVLCREFGIDPLGAIASGALLLAVSPSDLPSLQKAFAKESIPHQVIGEVKKGPSKVVTKDGNEVKPYPRDEILKTFENSRP